MMIKIRRFSSLKKATLVFWLQRLTAIINIPFIIFFILLLIKFSKKDYKSIYITLSNPILGFFIMFMLIICHYHMYLGMNVIIEDYIKRKCLYIIAIYANFLFCSVISILSFIFLVKIILGN